MQIQLDGEKPSDIYQVVADKTITKLEAIIQKAKGSQIEVDGDDKTSEHKLAQWWVDFG